MTADWDQAKAKWPHAEASRFIPTGTTGGRWHVQEMGSGDDLLLLHGAGGATQSFRHLLPLLSERYRAIALDLPGQGFSRPARLGRYGLDPMARDIAALVHAEGWRPRAIIGHSAGGALALRLAEEGVSETVIGINAALGRFEGVAGWAFPLAAKLLALNPFTALTVSTMSVAPDTVRRFLASTGSEIDAEGRAHYRRLIANPRHVDGTLRMMAAWNLDGLIARMPRNEARVVLLAAEKDGTVPPSVSEHAARRLPHAHVVHLEGLGHLAHEEAPALIADQIFAALEGARAVSA